MNRILFKPWKIKAIAESDREWQTRRLGGLKEINEHPNEWIFKGIIDGKYWFQHPQCERDDWLYNRYIKPRYHVGEVVYIKEAFWDDSGDIYFKSDCPEMPTNMFFEKGKWKSPLFLPEILARYFIKITGVRVERLQEITPRDCEAEDIDGRGMLDLYIKNDYRILWNSINAKWKRAWNRELKIYEYWQFPWSEADAKPIPKNTQHPERYHCIPNPWVFAYSFIRDTRRLND